jgi:lipopolysaccharide heptosyltransferase I
VRRNKREPQNIKDRPIKRILIIRLSAVGDVVRTLPSLGVLKKNFPVAKLVWLVEEKSSDLLLGQPELNEVIVFPRAAWGKSLARGKWWSFAKEFLGFIKKLRRDRFDLVVDFHGILKSGLLSVLTGAEVRVGFEKGFCKEMNHFFNNWRVSLPSDRMSRFERNRRLLEGIGLDTADSSFRLSVSSKDSEYITGFLKKHDLLARYPLVALHPGTSEKTLYKRWFPESYASLADRLVKELGASVILTWGPGERETAKQVHSLMKSPCVILCRTSLKQLAGIYQHCHLYVGGDTGPMHIASLMGVPVVAIYGPTDPVINAPYEGTPFVQVRKDLPCSPCRDRDCQRLDCLKAVRNEEVLKAAKDLFLQVKQAS